MYMQGFACNVTGNTGTIPLQTPAQVPQWCEGNSNNCTVGAKQMIYYNQQTGNNLELTGWQLDGAVKNPGYNMKNGFQPGAQFDIFAKSAAPAPPGNNGQHFCFWTARKSVSVQLMPLVI